MDGPERLESGPVRRSRRPWLAVGVALVVVAGLGAVRLAGVGPGPTPSVPTRGPTEDTTSWPVGMGSGTLYVSDGTGVASVDVGTGLVQRSEVDVSHVRAALTAFRGGVLVWPELGRGQTRWIGLGGTGALGVGGLVAQGRQFLPSGDSAWVTTAPEGSSGRSTWRLVDELDAVRARATAVTSGDVASDGSGGLFDSTDFHVRHVAPGTVTQQWNGLVLAVGPDGHEAETCVRDVCRNVLVDRRSGQETPVVRPASVDLGLGALSPGNRFIATVEPLSTDDPDGSTAVRVAEPGSDTIIRSIPAADLEQRMVWVSDRWLVADGRDGLVLYDAADDRLITPRTGLGHLLALAFQPA